MTLIDPHCPICGNAIWQGGALKVLGKWICWTCVIAIDTAHHAVAVKEKESEPPSRRPT